LLESRHEDMPDPKFPAEEAELSLEVPALTTRTRAMNPSSHDVVLQSRIWEQIRATRELDAMDVSIVVRNRSATLFGAVADAGQRAIIERIAVGISGVLEVTNRIKVGTPTH
jgi:osmotically-inducible protein OsmY